MDQRERFGDIEEIIRSSFDGLKSSMWTAMPAKLVAVSADGRTGTWQPLIKSVQRMADGTQKIVDLPVLQDVPIHHPGGGGVSVALPLKSGDEALIVFASRSTDSWDQSGDQQKQIDARSHDLSDGFALPGFKSKPNAMTGYDPNKLQITSNDGKSKIVMDPGTSLELNQEGMIVHVSKTRVDLGALGGPKVMTESGPSDKVFAAL